MSFNSKPALQRRRKVALSNLEKQLKENQIKMMELKKTVPVPEANQKKIDVLTKSIERQNKDIETLKSRI